MGWRSTVAVGRGLHAGSDRAQGCVHAFRAVGRAPARVLIIALPPSASEAYFRELARLPGEAGEVEWDALGKKWGNIVVGPPLESP